MTAELQRQVADNIRAHVDAFCEREGELLHPDGRVRPCSHAEVARRAGLSPRYLARLIAGPDAEHPPQWPRPEVLVALAEVLGVPPLAVLLPPE